jgi:hypothetical protein
MALAWHTGASGVDERERGGVELHSLAVPPATETANDVFRICNRKQDDHCTTRLPNMFGANLSGED